MVYAPWLSQGSLVILLCILRWNDKRETDNTDQINTLTKICTFALCDETIPRLTSLFDTVGFSLHL